MHVCMYLFYYKIYTFLYYTTKYLWKPFEKKYILNVLKIFSLSNIGK